MKILNIFGKRTDADAVLRLLAIIAALSGALLCASPCSAANNALQFHGADDRNIGIRKGGLTMKALKTFGKRMNAAAAMRLLAMVAALSGALLSASPCLAVNNALTFDGTDDYVITASPVTTATDNVTIEAWVKWGGGSSQVVVYNGNITGNGYGIFIGNPNISVLCGGVAFVSASVGFNVNVWQHVAAVRRSGTWELYLDGVGQTLTGNTTTPNAPAGATITGSNNSGSECFNGQIDEVRIWNTARTQPDIQASMNYPLSGSESGLAAYYNFDQTSGTTLPDLAGGDNNGTLTNMTGSEWTASGAPAPMTAPGNALAFARSSNQYVNVPNSSGINLTGNTVTVEAWIKADTWAANSWENTIVGKDSGSSTGYVLRCGNGKLSFVILNSSWAEALTGSVMTPGVWYHVAGTYDGTTIKAYINGVQQASDPRIMSIGDSSSVPLIIGESPGNTGRFFDGLIDEVRVWNTARSQTEIQQNMYKTLSSGPVACYNFDQTGGTVLTDLASGDNNGTLVNSPTWIPATWNYGYPYVSTGAVSDIKDTTTSVAGTLVDAGAPAATASGICYGTSANPTSPCTTDGILTTGSYTSSLTGLTRATAYYARAYATNSAGTSYGSDVMFMTEPGNALSFNGSNYVGVGDIGYIESGNFTISMWVKINNVPGDRRMLISNNYSYLGNYGWMWWIDASGGSNIAFQVNGSGGPAATAKADYSNYWGKWTHVAFVKEGSAMKLFLNGIEPSYIIQNSWITPNQLSTTRNIRIANRQDDSLFNFKGLIDEVQIWNTARSQSDIQTNMNKTLVGNEGGLAAYYNFDQTSGSTLSDMTANHYDGTVNGTAAWTAATWNYGYPYMSTGAASSIGAATASVASIVVDPGTSSLADGGICWNTSGNPTTSDSKTTSGSSSLAGLSGGVTYYARAYSTNTSGTGYGNEVSFTTLMNPPGNALSFNGSNQYVNTAAPVTAQTDNVTIEAWVKWGGGSGQAVVYNGNSANSGYGILIDNPNIFLMCGGVDVVSSSVGFTPNVWQHIAAVRRSGTWELYLDGVQKNLSGNTAMNPNTPAGSTLIGSTGSSQYFTGLIDEVRVWNTARSQYQIRCAMNRTLVGNESGLVAYYNFDRTSGTTLPDLAGGDNDGALTGSPAWVDSAAFNVWTGAVSTDWNTAGNWNDGVPTASSNVYIPSVTNQSSVGGSGACNHLVIDVSATVTVASGTLNVTGNIFSGSGTIAGTGAVVCSGTSAQTVKIVSFPNLTVNGAGIVLDSNLTVNGTLTMISGSITPGSYTIAYGAGGTLVYNGGGSVQTSTDIEFPAASGPANLTVNNTGGAILHASRTLSGTLTLTAGAFLIGANNTLTLNGGISASSGTLNGGDTSDLILGGTGNATLPANALTLNNLTLNRAGAVVILGNDLTVKGTLTLSAGILKVPSYNLLLGETAQIAGMTSASAMIVADIIGEVRKTIADGATLPVSFTFPVGSDSGTPEYSPVTLDFTEGTFASAYVGVRLKDLQYPVNSSPTDYLQRYWTVTQSGITAFSCDMTFAYVTADIHGTETNIYGKRHADSVWTTLDQAGSNQFTGTVTAFGSFTGADHTPVLATPLADVTVYEDAAPTSITLSSVFSDFDDDNLSVVKTVVSNTNPGLVPAAVSGETMTLSYTPNGNGSATVVIRGTANEKYAEDSITVTVIPVDDAPAVSQKIPDLTVNEDAPPAVIALSGVFADIDSASVAKSLLSNSNSILLTTSLEGDTLTLTCLKDQNGTADIVIRGTADGQYADTAFKVTVTPVDDPPVWITEIADVKATDGDPDTVIPLAGTVTDIDNEQSKIVFSAKSGNNSLVSSFVAGTSLTLRYAKERAGETTVTVTALSGGKTVSDTFSVILGTLKYAVSGKAVYFSNLLPVPNIKMMLTGTDFYTGKAVSAEIFTDSSGNYLFSDIVRGDYSVTPFRNDPPDPAKLSASDADVIADVALGIRSLTPLQYKAADVTLNGRVSGLDASRLSRFTAGLITEMSSSGYPAPEWISDTESLSFSLNADTADMNFTMYLTGDISGNYSPGTSGTSAREPGRTAEISVEQSSVLSVPIVISENTEFHGIDLDIEYNETVILAREATLEGGILDDRDYETAVNLNEPGRIRMAIFGYSGKKITGSGTVVILHFDVVGPVYSSSLLTFTRFDCNEIRVKSEAEQAVIGGFYLEGMLSDSLRIIVTPDPNYDPMDYDMNGDGKVDMKDAVQALRQGDIEGSIRSLQILTWR